MAKIPIEILTIGNVETIDVEQAISIANSVQNEFLFSTLSPTDEQPFKLLAFKKVMAKDFLDKLETKRNQIRGYHPFLIALIDSTLDGEEFGNLFGSHRAKTGLAVVTIANVENLIIPTGRMASYFLYYFARYSLSFVAPKHKNHDQSKDCVFDRKIHKLDIINSMKARAICDECRKNLLIDDSLLTPSQFEALDSLFEISGKVFNGETPLSSSLLYKDSSMGISDNSPLIKILFLASNPKDTQPLRLDAEVRAIDSSLQKTEFRYKFDLKQHWAVQINDIQELLLRYKPDIVHFSGHGSKSSEIILETITGDSHPVPPNALGQLFSVFKDNIKCVVLNACYSEQQAKAIAKNIDCVVGMSNAIGDNAAISFAASFYQALGYGRDVQTAFNLGCIQINLEGLNEEETPKLLSKVAKPSDMVFAKHI